jgi:hypothetical protein
VYVISDRRPIIRFCSGTGCRGWGHRGWTGVGAIPGCCQKIRNGPCRGCESSNFTDNVADLLGDAGFAHLQNELMARPDAGDVMPGCGGLRKLRLPDPKRQKGKRGGARVIYLHVPQANWIFLLDVYGKDEKEDLTAVEKKILKKLATKFKEEAIRNASKKGKQPNE